jgi:hypothetical protein
MAPADRMAQAGFAAVESSETVPTGRRAGGQSGFDKPGAGR